jgi:hypothetical protein
MVVGNHSKSASRSAAPFYHRRVVRRFFGVDKLISSSDPLPSFPANEEREGFRSALPDALKLKISIFHDNQVSKRNIMSQLLGIDCLPAVAITGTLRSLTAVTSLFDVPFRRKAVPSVDAKDEKENEGPLGQGIGD